MAWQFLAWTAGTFFVVFFCYLLRPLEFFPITFFTVIAATFIVFDPREWMLQSYLEAHEFLLHVPINNYVERYLHTAVTIISGLWLVRRTCQTLLKPVSELVMILGVDIPEPPNVCLAGIRSDAVTITWDRPPTNKPVHKYNIQVNGVHVGESPGNDFAITVTGLKPSHYYSIRVIAVAPNSFQSPSPPVLLQTWGKDGKPQPIDAPLPAHCSTDEHRSGTTDNGDDSDSPSGPVPSLESAPVLDSPISVLRDTNNGSLTNQRRNTINRRHSPSVTSSERPQTKHQGPNEPDESLDELNKQFESIRKEIDDVVAQISKEETEFKLQEDELKREKERKRRMLKEKEEFTAQLKVQVRISMEQMRTVEKERAKKEQSLKEKEAKRAKSKDNIKKMEQEIERMRNERKKFQVQRCELDQQRDEKVRSLDQGNKELQDKCAELESELKEKGKQLQDLKATRELLPGASDEHWDEEDRRLQQEFIVSEQQLKAALFQEVNRGRELELQIQNLSEQVAQAQQRFQQTYYPSMGSPAPDYDGSIPVQQARPSLNGASPHEQGTPSPHPLPTSESGYQPPSTFVHPPFPPRLFVDEPDPSDEPQAEVELKMASVSLSPLAQTLLPSNIFDELDDQSDEGRAGARIQEAISITGDEPHSPASSSPSYRAFSSPHGSSHNLPYPQYEPAERSSLNPHQTPNSPAASTHRFSDLLSTFQRNRGTKPVDEGPPIGSLKPGQSQSFPRGAEEFEGNEVRRRRNFLWSVRSPARPEGTTSHFSLVGRRLNSLSNGRDRDPDSRPASIASADMPRPSTDSSSIWGQPNDGMLPKHRAWQAGEGPWPSRSNSRRPSIHGTGNLLTTTLASADDEILDENDLRNPPQVGVIGSGPSTTTKSVNQRLNPNAPTFMGNMGNLFKKDRFKPQEAAPSLELPLKTDDSSSKRRISHETQSIHTQASVSVSESHESLTLDGTISNAPSDLNSLSGSVSKDAENKVKKLFRKGSSGKFSLTSRLGKDSGLFKKGPGSTANSDKNVPADQRSSIGDVDDVGEDVQFGRSYDSMASSSAPGSKGSKDGSQSRMASWRFPKKKKGKELAVKENPDTGE
ncbi:Fibronectin type III domain protein [Cordyceps fumosorosea ARSEF 2679]|uniref:Fibronectin type III domain protein n=1 Tax=Cordyceps fumosorosea (strain ARSEF 2679) TaxID=1081104 RepID=A0A167UGX2_CORFA|nr:Fibronectin type III domain protein [Cordyceps fumosorosea ARSEF 2679]OAA61568.1 Fibronectin type III domain protein [Cordyceps fumosorosea ARSEF 2679]